MSDVIVQRFEADANDFVREVNKARESVKKMTGSDLPLVRQELNSAFTQAQRTAQGMNHLGRETNRSGQNMMIMAQVADDAQYGMRGLNNQIPQLAMALGAGAGLAGAVSLVALALTYGIPLLKEFYSSADSDAAVKAAKSYGDAIEANLKKLEEIAAVASRADGLAELEARNMADAKQEATANGMVSAYERQLAALEKQRRVEDALRDARNGAAVAESRARGGDVTGVERSQVREAAAIAARRAAEDGKLLEDLRKISAIEGDRVAAAGKAWADGFTAQIAAAREELAKMERQQVFSAAAAAQAAAEFDAVKDKGFSKRQNETQNAKMTADRAALDKDAVAAQREILESLQKQAGEQAAIFEASRKELESKSAAAAQRVRDGKVEADAAGQIANERERELAATAEGARRARERDAAEERAAARKRAAAERERAAELQREQGLAREDVFAEVKALELQAAGRLKEAEALREGMKLRRDAAALAERAGISEKEAAGILARKLELEKAVAGEQRKAEMAGQRNDGRIRLFKRGESAGGAFGGGAREGLGASVIERNVRIAEQRAAARGDSGAGVTRTVEKLDDLYTVMRKQLEVWQTGLGVK
jgi:hypothetical protein